MTEQATFTAGPWKIAGATLVYGKTGTVCSCGEPRASDLVEYKEVHIGSADFYEACANARLIACAPDLLAALTDALAAFEIIAHHALSNGVKQLAVDNAEKVRVAISKARGE